ncbi:MAG: hypothetical protein AAGG79_06935, partial [Pseudomonadota bacterium]
KKFNLTPFQPPRPAMSYVPTTYEEWKHCITVKCDIPLTPSYVEERIAALKDDRDFHTEKFKSRWGAAHLSRTITGFERAKKELEAGS